MFDLYWIVYSENPFIFVLYRKLSQFVFLVTKVEKKIGLTSVIQEKLLTQPKTAFKIVQILAVGCRKHNEKLFIQKLLKNLTISAKVYSTGIK